MTFFALLMSTSCKPPTQTASTTLFPKEDKVFTPTSYKVFSQLCYSGELNELDLVGIWLLDVDCVPNLVNTAGFKIYTNRTDHLFVLKKDGSAVLRLAREYSKVSAKSRTLKDERDKYELWNSERLWRKLDRRPGAYYVWNPFGSLVVSGPYQDKPNITAAKVLKTNADGWLLVRRKWLEYDSGEPFWCVEFSLTGLEGGPEALRVGIKDRQLCLYLASHDTWPQDERRETFRFSKISEEELQKIARGVLVNSVE
jgi:hypothetical protein